MMKNCLTAILLTAVLSLSASASPIDFETTPSGAVPVDNAALSRFDSYAVGSVNVSFGFDTTLDGTVDTDGLFEHIGDEGGTFPGPNGFSSNFGVDTAAPGFEAQLGMWFLRSPTSVPANIGKFIITYDTPVTALGGEIWDIDGRGGPPSPFRGTEQWVLRVFDGANVEIASLTSPLGVSADASSLDGKPWAFGFSNLVGAVRVEAEFVGTKTAGVGFSFNNYSATTIPEPATVSLLAFGGLLLLRRRR